MAGLVRPCLSSSLACDIMCGFGCIVAVARNWRTSFRNAATSASWTGKSKKKPPFFIYPVCALHKPCASPPKSRTKTVLNFEVPAICCMYVCNLHIMIPEVYLCGLVDRYLVRYLSFSRSVLIACCSLLSVSLQQNDKWYRTHVCMEPQKSRSQAASRIVFASFSSPALYPSLKPLYPLHRIVKGNKMVPHIWDPMVRTRLR